MKCKDCACCKLGWFTSVPGAYVCVGVKEPFVINNIEAECTEYPEKNNVLEQQKCKYVVSLCSRAVTGALTSEFRIFNTRDEAIRYINECACKVYTPIANISNSHIEVICGGENAYAKVLVDDLFWYWKLCEVKF